MGVEQRTSEEDPALRVRLQKAVLEDAQQSTTIASQLIALMYCHERAIINTSSIYILYNIMYVCLWMLQLVASKFV